MNRELENLSATSAPESESFFRQIFESSSSSLLVLNQENSVHIANKALAGLFGYHVSELPGQPGTQLLPQLDTLDLAQTHPVFQGRRKDGSVITVELYPTQHGAYTLLSIVESKPSVQDEIEKHAQRLERAIRATNDGIWEWNIQTNEVWYSPALMKMIGRDPDKDQPLPQYWLDHIHPDDKHDVKSAMDAHIKKNEKFDVIYRGMTQSGHYEWVHSRGNSICDEQGRKLLMSGTLTNIHETRLLEHKLAEQSHFLNAVLEKSLCGIYIFDLQEKRNIYINEQYTAITGYDLEGLNKAQSNNLMPLFHHDDETRIYKHFSDVIDSSSEQGVSIDYRFRHRKGHWIWCYSRDSVYKRSPTDEPLQMIGTFFDITDIKTAEKTLAESNASLERFAYSASHDLQEPLRKITAFSDSLQGRLRDKLTDEEAKYELERIANAAKRMRDMINSLLELSRYSRQKVNKDMIALTDIIKTVKEDLAELINESQAKIVLRKDMNILVDKYSFQQVLQNLFINSIRYARPNIPAEIIINCKNDHNYYTLSILDNGTGFSEKAASKIFDPFKRLVGRGVPGSGMGLSICQQIVKAHGGTITADGHSQQGALFTITLPLHIGA